ncbi:IS1 family transposase, partial [Shigella sonnei]
MASVSISCPSCSATDGVVSSRTTSLGQYLSPFLTCSQNWPLQL